MIFFSEKDIDKQIDVFRNEHALNCTNATRIQMYIVF